MCRILEVENLLTTPYHLQTHGLVKQLNCTIMASLRHYIAEHPKDWDFYCDLITYAYSTHIRRVTGCAPCVLVLSRSPLSLALEPSPQDISNELSKAFYH